ncbi:reverse transcriptase domain-containing protein [Tanacetum coccineum]
MHTRASNFELVEPLAEPERTLNRRLRRRNRRVPLERRNERPKHPRVIYPPVLDINHFHHFLNLLENFNPMDDEPMWAADRVSPQFDDRIKIGPHKHIHKFLCVCDMFKYGETENEAIRLMMFPLSLTSEAKTWLDELNEGTFESWDDLPYQLLEDKVLLKLEWAKNQNPKPSLKKTIAFADEGSSNSDTNKVMARMDAMTMKMDAQNKEIQSRAKCNHCRGNHPTADCNDDDIPMSHEEEAKFDRLADKQSARPSGSLPTRNEHVNAVFTRSGKTYDPPTNPNKLQNDSQNPINFDSDDEDEESTPTPKPQTPKPIKEPHIPKPYKPKIPYPQRLQKENMDAQYGKFLDMIRVIRINIPLIDVLAGMPNYGKFLKELVSKKHKLEQISSAFLSDESSAMIQNKVPPKLGDPESFLIPYTFGKTFSCNALADLGASINLMPYSLYAKLSLKTLKLTKMSVRLANRSFQYPIGIAENMLIEVGKFTFPIDFVILEMEEDSKAPLILERPFLHTTDAVIHVKQKKLNLGVSTEPMTFSIDSAMKHSYSNNDTCFSIDIIDEILEENFDALLIEGSKILYSIEGTLLEDQIFAEFDEFMAINIEENSGSDITFDTDYKIKKSLDEPHNGS